MSKERAITKVRDMTKPRIFTVPLKLSRHGIGWLFHSTELMQRSLQDDREKGKLHGMATEDIIYMREVQEQLTRFAAGFQPGTN